MRAYTLPFSILQWRERKRNKSTKQVGREEVYMKWPLKQSYSLYLGRGRATGEAEIGDTPTSRPAP
jgi:hypothetical protein